jgi:hypothetical protein
MTDVQRANNAALVLSFLDRAFGQENPARSPPVS